MTAAPQPFVVTLEHAQRAFKCARVEWSAYAKERTTAHWIVTLAGRPVWSFDASASDTSESVRSEVIRWCDAGGVPSR